MKNSLIKFFLVSLGVLTLALLVSALAAYISEKRRNNINVEVETLAPVNYSNEIATKCLGHKNTVEQNRLLQHGFIHLEFEMGYSLEDIQDFIMKNNYQIQGNIYSDSKPNGMHSLTLLIPTGEEFCWARELENELGIEKVWLSSTLRPD